MYTHLPKSFNSLLILFDDMLFCVVTCACGTRSVDKERKARGLVANFLVDDYQIREIGKQNLLERGGGGWWGVKKKPCRPGNQVLFFFILFFYFSFLDGVRVYEIT